MTPRCQYESYTLNNDERILGRRFRETLLRDDASSRAPGLTARMWVGVEVALVGADDAGLGRPVDRLVRGHVVGAESVVVEKKQ